LDHLEHVGRMDFLVTCCGGRTIEQFESLEKERRVEYERAKREQDKIDQELKAAKKELKADKEKLHQEEENRANRVETKANARLAADARKHQENLASQSKTADTSDERKWCMILETSMKTVEQKHYVEVASMYHDHMQQLKQQQKARREDVAHAVELCEKAATRNEHLQKKLTDFEERANASQCSRPVAVNQGTADGEGVSEWAFRDSAQDKERSGLTVEPLLSAVAKLTEAKSHSVAIMVSGLLKQQQDVKKDSDEQLETARKGVEREQTRLQEVENELEDVKKKLLNLGVSEDDFERSLQSESNAAASDDQSNAAASDDQSNAAASADPPPNQSKP